MTIKLGILGLGGHYFKSHHEHFLKNSKCEIAAVFDLDKSKTDKFKNIFPNCFIAPSETDLLCSDVGAVVIMTPDQHHISSTLSALEHGKNVLCEKPLVSQLTSLGLLDRAISLAKEKNLVLTSCHPRRMDPPFIWLKDNLSELKNQFGQAIRFEFDFSYRDSKKTYLHSGLLVDHLNHEIDLMHFLFGYSDFVIHKLYDSQEKYAVAGQRQDGLTFVFSGTRFLKENIFPEFCRVRFETAEILLDTHSGVAILKKHGSMNHVDWTYICGKTDYLLRFKMVNDDFIENVLGLSAGYLSLKDLKLNTEPGIFLQSRTSFTMEHKNAS